MRNPGLKWLGIAVALGLLPGCGGSGPTGVNPVSDLFPDAGNLVHTPGGGITRFCMHNVIYRLDANMVTTMPDMDADVHVHQPGMPFVPGNIHDYDIQIHTGTIIKDQVSMSHLFNDYVFNYPGCPLSDAKVTCTPGKLSMSCTLHQGPLALATTMDGTLHPAADGLLHMHLDSIRAIGFLPVPSGAVSLTGVSGVINSHPDRGMEMNGDDVVITIGKALPPPVINGTISGVEVQQGAVVMHFDDGVHRPPPKLPQPRAVNWICMQGGDVLINRTLLKNADLEEVDQTPQDPMYYYLPAYLTQLQAGFVVQANDDSSLTAYVPDVHGTTVEQGVFQPPGMLAPGPAGYRTSF